MRELGEKLSADCEHYKEMVTNRDKAMKVRTLLYVVGIVKLQLKELPRAQLCAVSYKENWAVQSVNVMKRRSMDVIKG